MHGPSATRRLFLSTPDDFRQYSGLAVSWRSYQPFQPLFGFDAQFRAFAALAEKSGHEPTLLPAPEFFSSEESYRRLAEAARIAPAAIASLCHVRFGPPASLHVLKRTRNLAVVAAAPDTSAVHLGRHPFAGGERAPHCFEAVLGYGDTETTLFTIMGAELPARQLPDPFIVGDLGARRHTPIASSFELYQNHPSVLDIRSLAEAPAKLSSPHGATAGRSDDFAAALRDGKIAVLLPWNLADPGSAAPDMLWKLFRYASPDSLPCAVVVFPYNVTPVSVTGFEQALGRLRELAAPVSRLAFIASMRDIAHSNLLPLLFRLAWVDASDPEVFWTRRRLAAVSLPVALLADTGAVAGDPPPAFTLRKDEHRDVYARDAWGIRFVRGRTLSTRRLAELVRRSAEFPHRQPLSGALAQASLPERFFETLLAPVKPRRVMVAP